MLRDTADLQSQDIAEVYEARCPRRRGRADGHRGGWCLWRMPLDAPSGCESASGCSGSGSPLFRFEARSSWAAQFACPTRRATYRDAPPLHDHVVSERMAETLRRHYGRRAGARDRRMSQRRTRSDWRRPLQAWALKALFRVPVPLARIRDGRLFGHRALLLVHRGRMSGRCHLTMLEVIGFDADRREAYVVAGFGRRAQWLQNLAAGSPVEVRMAGERYPAAWRELPVYEAVDVLGRYERRHSAHCADRTTRPRAPLGAPLRWFARGTRGPGRPPSRARSASGRASSDERRNAMSRAGGLRHLLIPVLVLTAMIAYAVPVAAAVARRRQPVPLAYRLVYYSGWLIVLTALLSTQSTRLGEEAACWCDMASSTSCSAICRPAAHRDWPDRPRPPAAPRPPRGRRAPSLDASGTRPGRVDRGSPPLAPSGAVRRGARRRTRACTAARLLPGLRSCWPGWVVVEPIPGPRWFGTGSKVLYVFAMRLVGLALANIALWMPTVLYGVRRRASCVANRSARGSGVRRRADDARVQPRDARRAVLAPERVARRVGVSPGSSPIRASTHEAGEPADR